MTMDSMAAWHQVGLDRMRSRARWCIVLGALLIAAGTFALVYSLAATFATMLLLGWLMLVAGGVQAAHAFSYRDWGGFIVDLLIGVLYFVGGLLIVRNPLPAAEALTLLIGMMLIFSGIFRALFAVAAPIAHRGWLIINGLVSLLLGVSVVIGWPWSGLWLIGTFVGIDLVFNGWTLIMLGFAVRRVAR